MERGSGTLYNPPPPPSTFEFWLLQQHDTAPSDHELYSCPPQASTLIRLLLSSPYEVSCTKVLAWGEPITPLLHCIAILTAHACVWKGHPTPGSPWDASRYTYNISIFLGTPPPHVKSHFDSPTQSFPRLAAIWSGGVRFRLLKPKLFDSDWLVPASGWNAIRIRTGLGNDDQLLPPFPPPPPIVVLAG